MRLIVKSLLLLILTGLILGGFLSAGIYAYLKPQLPSPDALRDVRLQVPLRIYSSDGLLMAEFGEKRRTPVALSEVPKTLIDAFLAAEDDGFNDHVGIDPTGLIRAAFELVSTGSIQSGGSTITMQVARNYFLSREQTFTRKFKEILLALEIEQTLSKDEILELYLNKIYLGKRAYGVHAAAAIYYDKTLEELDLAQSAMIAGLPKAPSKYNPVNNPERALIRRNWILDRMLTLGLIEQAQRDQAHSQPMTASVYQQQVQFEAPWVAEEARVQLEDILGESIYTQGFQVHLTVNSERQAAAQRAVLDGLMEYDRRHGWRGPEAQLDGDPAQWLAHLQSLRPDIGGLVPVVVHTLTDTHVEVLTRDNQRLTLGMDALKWAKPRLRNRDALGSEPTDPRFLAVGDLVRVTPGAQPLLAQLPDAQAAFVALKPDTGAIEALIGGFDFTESKFNRALLANRQVGSGIKPFIYTAALQAGYTPASIINDAPIVFKSGELQSAWRPQNSGGKFYGPTRLREALYRSRNLVSVRLLREMGIDATVERLAALGLPTEKFPRNLSLALGSGSLSALEMASRYASFANGGYRVEPWLIDRVVDSRNAVVLRTRPAIACPDLCPEAPIDPVQAARLEPQPEVRLLSEALDIRWAPRVIGESEAFLINSMMRDVVARGTGRRALELKRTDLAGKTGTTNDQVDAWFNGFHRDQVASAWVGLDQPDTLGRREYGGAAALPIWIDYMRVALADAPMVELTPPASVVKLKIDARTGREVSIRAEGIFEWFAKDRTAAAGAASAGDNTTASNETQGPKPKNSQAAPSAADAAKLF
ncbi:penicillin-binding protein 1A [Litorivicinus lipolyticus]|uniref:penicillin-binding protein 1A n=1 Tax=Litorivicinus lipolyticus TaxID=418701 RepID=UPI00147806AC|nr:penicillin-binding protein 1A [Litorivicinus lipolyticus]